MSSNLLWVDYTRRNDPAGIYWVNRLEKILNSNPAPKVFCFWTKNPGFIAREYKEIISKMISQGTIVLAQVTYNYYPGLETIGVPYNTRYTGLENLINLLGRPKHVRLRMDPIIPGYTTPGMINKSINDARQVGINHVITNILVPSYKGVGKLLLNNGIITEADLQPTDQRIHDTFLVIVKYAQANGIQVSTCAETAGLVKSIPGLGKAQCADPTWPAEIRPDINTEFRIKASRKGCGCVYSQDWGLYTNQGAPPCPHQCMYCYAK